MQLLACSSLHHVLPQAFFPAPSAVPIPLHAAQAMLCLSAGRHRPAIKRGNSMEARLEWLQEGLVKQQSDMESALHRDDSNARWELDQQVAELPATENSWQTNGSPSEAVAAECLQSQQANPLQAMSATGRARSPCAGRCAKRRSACLKLGINCRRFAWATQNPHAASCYGHSV